MFRSRKYANEESWSDVSWTTRYFYQKHLGCLSITINRLTPDEMLRFKVICQIITSDVPIFMQKRSVERCTNTLFNPTCLVMDFNNLLTEHWLHLRYNNVSHNMRVCECLIRDASLDVCTAYCSTLWQLHRFQHLFKSSKIKSLSWGRHIRLCDIPTISESNLKCSLLSHGYLLTWPFVTAGCFLLRNPCTAVHGCCFHLILIKHMAWRILWVIAYNSAGYH